jgi:hypothetical protein
MAMLDTILGQTRGCRRIADRSVGSGGRHENNWVWRGAVVRVWPHRDGPNVAGRLRSAPPTSCVIGFAGDGGRVV